MSMSSEVIQILQKREVLEDLPGYLKSFGVKGEDSYNDGAKFEYKPQKKCLDDIIKIKTEPGICVGPCVQKTQAEAASGISIWSSKMNWKMESDNPNVKEMNAQRSHGPKTENQLAFPRLTEAKHVDSDLKLHICGISSCKSNQELYHDASPQADGLYHCPWEKDPSSGCQHKPKKLKCKYQYGAPHSFSTRANNDAVFSEYVDFHLKSYKCKFSHCQQQGLRFKSAGCLLRHNREAHNLRSPKASGPVRLKKRKDYPIAWGCLPNEGSMKKRVPIASDGSTPDWEKAEAKQKRVHIEEEATADEGRKYMTDLDLFHTAAEKGPWIADDLSTPDLDYLTDTDICFLPIKH